MQKNREQQEFNDIAAVTDALVKRVEDDESLTVKFNRATLNGLVLTLLHSPDFNRDIGRHDNWQEQAQKTGFAVLCNIINAFDDGWPAPTEPAKPADNSDHSRIVYERGLKEYKKLDAIYRKQRPGALKWFVQEAVKSFPGRKETMVGANDIRASLPDPISETEWVDYAETLTWYLTEKSEGLTKPRTLQDLKGKDLHDIRRAFEAEFPGDITSSHLLRCDNMFLNQPIDSETNKLERHPDTETIHLHAEIIATGTCADGEGWTMRRINSREAAIEYGNPSGRKNASSLCFTWDTDRRGPQHYQENSHDLLMICRDSGERTRFVNIETKCYKDMDDADVAQQEFYDEYCNVLEAVIRLETEKLTYFCRKQEWERYCVKFEHLAFVTEDSLKPMIVAQLQPPIDHFLNTNNYSSCAMLLEAARDHKGPAIQTFGKVSLPRIFEQLQSQSEFRKAVELLSAAEKNTEFHPVIESLLPQLLESASTFHDKDFFFDLLEFTNKNQIGEDSAKAAIKKVIEDIIETEEINVWADTISNIIVLLPLSYAEPAHAALAEILGLLEKPYAINLIKQISNEEAATQTLKEIEIADTTSEDVQDKISAYRRLKAPAATAVPSSPGP